MSPIESEPRPTGKCSYVPSLGRCMWRNHKYIYELFILWLYQTLFYIFITKDYFARCQKSYFIFFFKTYILDLFIQFLYVDITFDFIILLYKFTEDFKDIIVTSFAKLLHFPNVNYICFSLNCLLRLRCQNDNCFFDTCQYFYKNYKKYIFWTVVCGYICMFLKYFLLIKKAVKSKLNL